MKKKTSKPSRVRLSVILVTLVLLGAAWGAYRFYPKSDATIFVVATPMEYGERTVEGVIQKDTSANEEGLFYLLTSDNQTIKLDVIDIEPLIGSEVIAKGFVNPPDENSTLPAMSVSTLEAK